MYGYAGRMIQINLTKNDVVVETLKKELTSQYLGGKGFGAKILIEKMTPKTGPYDPANLLIFPTGPVNGTTLSEAAKFCAVFKSPLTGIWGESQCGGHFAPQFKFAGYDMITIQGRSEKPVYIAVEDEKIEVRDATHLWDKDTFETEGIIKKGHGEKFQVLSIGLFGP